MKKIERPNYFTGEALLTDDFICEQQYQMTMLASHNASLHTYGIAQGLAVSRLPSTTDNPLVQLKVTGGMAIDALGRQIILLQPAVMTLDAVDPGITYFITINYHEVFTDLSDETGTAGYKRIVQQPQLKFLRNLDEPGINILLAVLSVTSEGAVNSLTYKSGRNQRRYIGSSVGSIDFVTEGAGVNPNANLQANADKSGALTNFGGARLFANFASISAKLDGDGTAGSDGSASSNDFYLEFDAPRGQFMGLLTTRNNLGVGNDHPVANLQVDAITFKGSGQISSTGPLVTFTNGPTPFLQIGDILISDPSAGGKAQSCVVTKIILDGSQLNVSPVFSPPLSDSGYTYMRSALARFSVNNASSLLQVNIDGSIGLGTAALVKGGADSVGPHALTITPDRKVGIALSAGAPQAALEVNGQILASSLTASGAIVASSFEGNGSKLQGLSILSDWTKVTPGATNSNLYYYNGNVGVRETNPIASLSVGGGDAFIGSGFLTSMSSTTVLGYQTAFQDQLKVGDQIVIGTLIEQTSVVASIPASDTELTLLSQFGVPVLNSSYSVLPVNSAPNTVATPGVGTVTSNGTRINGTGTKFTNMNAGDTLVIPAFMATSNLQQQGQKVSAVIDDTHLTLSAAYNGVVDKLTYSVQTGTAAPVTGDGTISSTGVDVVGVDTVFRNSVKVGDTLLTHPVQPNADGFPIAGQVKSIESQFQFTLEDSSSGISFTGANSTYMVTSGLLAQFKANSSNPILSGSVQDAQPPAMLIVTNNNKDNANTVAINVAQVDVDRTLALQVVGNVAFSGGTVDYGNLVVDTLTANTSVTIGSKVATAPLLTVGSPASSAPLLVVTPTNVVIGQTSGSATLDVKGSINASSTITSSTQVQGATLNSTGNITAKSGSVQAATLMGQQLNVSGLQINPLGNVNFFGARTVNTLSGTTISQNAVTDGYILAQIGQVDSSNPSYIGMLTGSTKAQGGAGAATYSVSVTGQTVQRTIQAGKKGRKTYNIPFPGTFCMPVANGEQWTLTVTAYSELGNTPQVTWYWLPLGNSSSPSLASAGMTTPGTQGSPALDAVRAAAARPTAADVANAATHPATIVLAELQKLNEQIQAASTPAARAAGAQQTINQRVSDLTQILGDATHMSSNADDRAAFVRDLQKIVCAPSASGQLSAQPVTEQTILDLVNTFGKISGHVFTSEQTGLLIAGVNALIQINDSPDNRNDLNLIKKNIDLFIDNMQQVLQTPFSSQDQRLLTRALTRLVGDGTSDLVAQADTNTAPGSSF